MGKQIGIFRKQATIIYMSLVYKTILYFSCALLSYDINAQENNQSRLVRKIAYVKYNDCQYVGRAPVVTRQYSRFDSLRRHATTSDLIKLTEHRSPVVRAYAFEALCERKEADLFSIVYRHQNDLAKVDWRCGCFGGTNYVITDMLNMYKKSIQYKIDTTDAHKILFINKTTNKLSVLYRKERSKNQKSRWLHRARQERRRRILESRNDS